MKVPLTVVTAGLFLTISAVSAFAGAPPCGSEETLATPDGEIFVYVGDTVEVWRQSNVLAGLQRSACDDGNGRLLVPDTKLV